MGKGQSGFLGFHVDIPSVSQPSESAKRHSRNSCRFPPPASLPHFCPPLSCLSFSFRFPSAARSGGAPFKSCPRLSKMSHPIRSPSVPVREAVFSPFLWIPSRSPPASLPHPLIPLCPLSFVAFRNFSNHWKNRLFADELPDCARVESRPRNGRTALRPSYFVLPFVRRAHRKLVTCHSSLAPRRAARFPLPRVTSSARRFLATHHPHPKGFP